MPNPKLYTEAGSVLDRAFAGAGNVKSLCLSSNGSGDDKRQLYALSCETLKYRSALNEILSICSPSTDERIHETSLGLVLTYDCLFGRGVRCGGWMKTAMQHRKTELFAALTEVKQRHGVVNNNELVPPEIRDAAPLPRYARINTLKTTIDDAISQLISLGHIMVDDISVLDSLYAAHKIKMNRTGKKRRRTDDKDVTYAAFCRDAHLNEILVFLPGADLHAHPLYENGVLILQDKASCIPAAILDLDYANRQSRDLTLPLHVIDACAAPGNKTSHAVARMGGHGHVFAFDLSSRRLKLLRRLTNRVGAGTSITTICKSFLDVDPLDPMFAAVELAIVDPSCSGSGIVDRMDNLTTHSTSTDGESERNEAARLEALSCFQQEAILHAMRFPCMRQISYSTCSIHHAENEGVVAAVLDRQLKDERITSHFSLAYPLPSWGHRGEPNGALSSELARRCLRASPQQDRTIGFFVALFTRQVSLNVTSVPAVSTAGDVTGMSFGCSSNILKLTSQEEKRRKKYRKKKRNGNSSKSVTM